MTIANAPTRPTAMIDACMALIEQIDVGDVPGMSEEDVGEMVDLQRAAARVASRVRADTIDGVLAKGRAIRLWDRDPDLVKPLIESAFDDLSRRPDFFDVVPLTPRWGRTGQPSDCRS